jgi:hypothetical protein
MIVEEGKRSYFKWLAHIICAFNFFCTVYYPFHFIYINIHLYISFIRKIKSTSIF